MKSFEDTRIETPRKADPQASAMRDPAGTPFHDALASGMED